MQMFIEFGKHYQRDCLKRSKVYSIPLLNELSAFHNGHRFSFPNLSLDDFASTVSKEFVFRRDGELYHLPVFPMPVGYSHDENITQVIQSLFVEFKDLFLKSTLALHPVVSSDVASLNSSFSDLTITNPTTPSYFFVKVFERPEFASGKVIPTTTATVTTSGTTTIPKTPTNSFTGSSALVRDQVDVNSKDSTDFQNVFLQHCPTRTPLIQANNIKRLLNEYSDIDCYVNSIKPLITEEFKANIVSEFNGIDNVYINKSSGIITGLHNSKMNSSAVIQKHWNYWIDQVYLN